MRRLFTTEQARSHGLTSDALRWGEKRGRWRRIERGVYGMGPERPSPLDRARARVLASGGVASGRLAGVLRGFDGVELGGRPTRRRAVARERVSFVGGVPCTDGLQTLVDLSAALDDLRWEQALEFALRKRFTTVGELESLLPELGRSRTPGTARMRRVLTVRPAGEPPTESLLETLMVQLARRVPGLPDPKRQVDVVDEHGNFVARVDLAWPELGLFIELDGQQHEGQPVYDASRETAIVAATGWLCARFTWHEVVHIPTATARRLAAVVQQARRRGIAA